MGQLKKLGTDFDGLSRMHSSWDHGLVWVLLHHIYLRSTALKSTEVQVKVLC